MFETSVVRVHAVAAPRRMGLLTASVAFHSLVIVAAVVMTVRSVDFPKKAPNEMELFRVAPPVSLPPALGTPRAATPRPPAPQAHAVPRPATPAAAVTAPAVVPDTVTPAAASTAAVSDVPSSGAATGGEEPIGQPDGEIGGFGDQPTTGVPTGVLTPGAGVQSAVVLHRVEPRYPPAAVAAHMNGTVVLRCIIGKDGTCRDPEIVASTFGAFNQAAIDAVRQWRFAPGTYRGRWSTRISS